MHIRAPWPCGITPRPRRHCAPGGGKRNQDGKLASAYEKPFPTQADANVVTLQNSPQGDRQQSHDPLSRQQELSLILAIYMRLKRIFPVDTNLAREPRTGDHAGDASHKYVFLGRAQWRIGRVFGQTENRPLRGSLADPQAV